MIHSVIRDQFSDYLDERAQSGKPVSQFVVDEFNKFVRCGDPSWGYATMYCVDCGSEHNVAFSCKRRGFCTHCLAHRQQVKSRFLQERVIGDTPVRPWVVCLPQPLRNLGPFDSGLATDILNDETFEISHYLRWKAKRELGRRVVEGLETGAATVIHRVSSNLHSNLHYHNVFSDGVFLPGEDGSLTFCEVSPPTAAELAEVSWRICRRVVKTLKKRGLWEDATPVPGDPEGTLTGRLTIGPTKRLVRFFAVTSEAVDDDPVARNGACAFSVWAGRRIDRGQGKALRRHLRYLLSAPIADHQLTWLPDGNVLFRFRRPRRDGTTTRVLTPFELLDQLVKLTPRPWVNLIRFHGVYAPNAKRRAEAVPPPVKEPAAVVWPDETPEDRAAQAELRRYVHKGEARRCPRCRGRVRLLRLHSHRVKYQRSREWIRATQRRRDSGQAAA